MRRDRSSFLTEKDFDTKLLIENLQKNSQSRKLDDQKILNEVINADPSEDERLEDLNDINKAKELLLTF